MTKKKSQTPSIGTPAIQTLNRAGVTFTLHTFDASPSTLGYGAAAATALGVEPDRVFKTLMISLQGGPHPTAVAIVPVTGHVQLKALAHALDAKRAEMLDPAAAERLTGYVVGGISPFGQRRCSPTIIDRSALSWETIYVSAGRRDADVEVKPRDLIDVLQATVADISERGRA
ncbi:MAG: Cys-tRNA(Pro) deacylase [Actinomycetota bacterium]